MSNLIRGASIDGFSQVSVYLGKQFQRRRFLKIGQSETIIVCATICVNRSGRHVQSLQRNVHRFFLPSLFSKAISESERFQKSNNQKQELSVTTMFVNGSERRQPFLSKTFLRHFIPSFGLFVQAVSEEKIFQNRPIKNNSFLWRPYLLMDRAKCAIFRKAIPQLLPDKFDRGVSEEKIKM